MNLLDSLSESKLLLFCHFFACKWEERQMCQPSGWPSHFHNPSGMFALNPTTLRNLLRDSVTDKGVNSLEFVRMAGSV